MAIPRFLPPLHRTGWEFWLPPPLIAAVFWVVGNTMMNYVLSRSYGSVNTLQTDTALHEMLPVNILSINAEIDRNQGITTVFIRTTDSGVKDLRYSVPLTQVSEVEVAIAQKIKVPADTVRKVVSYRIKE
jgi:hypothetical protein